MIITYQDKKYLFTFKDEGIYIKEITDPDNQLSLFEEPPKPSSDYDYAMTYGCILHYILGDDEESD